MTMMQRWDGTKYNTDNWLEILSYLATVNKKYKVKEIYVNPSFFAKEIVPQRDTWSYSALSKCRMVVHSFGLNAKLKICSTMDGNFFALCENKVRK